MNIGADLVEPGIRILRLVPTLFNPRISILDSPPYIHIEEIALHKAV